jgi:hypothetical protein
MAKIGRPKAVLMVTEVERTELVRLTKRAHVNRLLAFRARLVLACADAPTDTVVARRCRTTNTTVGKWRKRFIERRLEGLLDEPRVGGPRTISDADVEAVVVQTLETTPTGETHWSTRTMAAKAGMSHTMIGRIWRTFGLKPHITQSFKMSPDPQLVDKIRDVVGLNMNPPNNAVVFSKQYSTIVSVTNPLANITVDPNLKAPRTDTFSIGVDRQLMAQLAFHTSYVYKNSKDLIGWADIGGVYGQGTTVLPDGRTLLVYRLVNSPSARLFQRTNPAGWYDT